jgi:hypothetical protein
MYSRSDRSSDDDGVVGMIEGHDGERKTTSSTTSAAHTNGSHHNGSAGSISANTGAHGTAGADHLVQTYLTKNTPITWLSFTPRNLLLAGGVFMS